MKWGSSLIFALLFFANRPLTTYSQSRIKIEAGDLLFLDLDCGPLCDAIEAVTQGFAGKKFSHVGLISIRNDSIWVIEAIGKQVKETHLPVFLGYSKKKPTVGRLKSKFRELIPLAVAHVYSRFGYPYDEAFLPENGKYYCSELIYEAFLKANRGMPVFNLEPMTFKNPETGAFFPVWEEYYQKLGMEIPEGKPGCNPGGLSQSVALEILGEF